MKCTMFYGRTECPIVEFIVKRKSLGTGNDILNDTVLGQEYIFRTCITKRLF